MLNASSSLQGDNSSEKFYIQISSLFSLMSHGLVDTTLNTQEYAFSAFESQELQSSCLVGSDNHRVRFNVPWLGWRYFKYPGVAFSAFESQELQSSCLVGSDNHRVYGVYEVKSCFSTMHLGFFKNSVWCRSRFTFQPNLELEPEAELKDKQSAGRLSPKHILPNIKLWQRSLQSILPFIIKSKDENPISSVKGEQKRHGRSHRASESMSSLPRFRPYVARVPWHKGARAFLSHLFPRYGHYCGPNWSSGKDNGSMIWDKRPIDWLDFCCYCHDMGYDTLDQAQLLKADLAFLECLEKPQMSTKGDARVAHFYRTMSIAGLRNILIPYRRQLVRLQEEQPLLKWLGNLSVKGMCTRQMAWKEGTGVS